MCALNVTAEIKTKLMKDAPFKEDVWTGTFTAHCSSKIKTDTLQLYWKIDLLSSVIQ